MMQEEVAMVAKEAVVAEGARIETAGDEIADEAEEMLRLTLQNIGPIT